MADQQPYGLVARYRDAEALRNAAQRLHDAGFTRIEAYSPMPIDGMPEAMGLGRNPLPAIGFAAFILGGASAFGLEAYSAGLDYPWNIGGRPLFNWPSFVPLTFEFAVLVTACSVFFFVCLLCRLTRLYDPVANADQFERASTDGYFLCVRLDRDGQDADAATIRQALTDTGAQRVQEVSW